MGELRKQPPIHSLLQDGSRNISGKNILPYCPPVNHGTAAVGYVVTVAVAFWRVCHPDVARTPSPHHRAEGWEGEGNNFTPAAMFFFVNSERNIQASSPCMLWGGKVGFWLLGFCSLGFFFSFWISELLDKCWKRFEVPSDAVECTCCEMAAGALSSRWNPIPFRQLYVWELR